MTLTVQQMSRMLTYLAAKSNVDKFIADNKLSDKEAEEARSFWTETGEDLKKLPKGTQIALPGEWE